MGYRILYGSKQYPHPRQHASARLPVLTGVCFLLFCVLTAALWPEGLQTLRDALFPASGAVTAAALEHMAEQLRTGGPVLPALGSFFREILAFGPG